MARPAPPVVKRQWSERAEQVLQLFAGLIAQYIQKRALLNSCAKPMLRWIAHRIPTLLTATEFAGDF